ncbi:hypothetical protein ASE85_04835 [Sphingobium sp. Leaf26]|uniref:hypothetical protein n=1 Tax=Sphingobium sp. Leaf26 TaxID=1735693 RepID=UPI0006FDA92B|nr:hypothetical protein [Sphingobium sp. Leaf26]KQN04378.1 hypothetical protein ASE85_04835 [Sphingobium sp. Leaf26]
MNPIVREFFRGLKERNELDAILPELLTTMGFEVISRPMIGTVQYGADVAAIGTDDDDVRKLFLFAIKRGDLGREGWDNGVQALRPSLNQIRDAYLLGVAPEHKNLPVVVVATIGGVLLETAKLSVNGYLQTEGRPGLEFRLWTGDTLTGKIVDGALREEVFSPELRGHLRRAAALVDEPESALDQFMQLVEKVIVDTSQSAPSRIRILYLALWILTVWGREADNLDAPYRASELLVLRAWELLWPEVEQEKGRKREASYTLHEVIQLHLRIWDELYGAKILPRAANLHALSFAVWSHESVDINLALFETLGRVALGGLWHAWLRMPPDTPLGLLEANEDKVTDIAVALLALIENNPALLTPICDDQAIDVCLALLLLTIVPDTRAAAAHWVSQISIASVFSFSRGAGYPIISRDYADLIRHPGTGDDEYVKEMTAGSILYPLLAAFARALGEDEVVTKLGGLQTVQLAHSNFQTWVPNPRSEGGLWRGKNNGSSLGNLSIGADAEALVAALRREVEQDGAYAGLSAIRLDHWPILLLACRAHRFPPPPHIWLPLIDALENPALDHVGRWVRSHRRIGSRRIARAAALISTAREALTHRLPPVDLSSLTPPAVTAAKAPHGAD